MVLMAKLLKITIILLVVAASARLTVLPLPGCGVDVAEELVRRHSLRVQVVAHGLLLHVLRRPEERAPHLRLARARLPDDEHAVTHLQELLQLHHLWGRRRDE